MRFVAAVFGLVLGLVPALASGIERQGAFILAGPNADYAILADQVTQDTPADLDALLRSRPNLKSLVLTSGGGSVAGSVILADAVQQRGLNTYIPAGYGCYATCAYVFLAGAARRNDGELGVNQFYADAASAAQGQFKVLDILSRLTRYGTPQEVTNRMMRTPTGSVFVFTSADAERIAIDRNGQALQATSAAIGQLPDDVLLAMGPLEPGQTQVAAAPPAGNTPPAGGSTQQSVPRFAIYEGVDFYGSDIDKLRTDTLEQCFQACVDNRQCNAMTVNLDPAAKVGPNCFLKTNMGDTVHYPHAVSGAFLAADFDGVLEIDGKRVSPTEIIALQ